MLKGNNIQLRALEPEDTDVLYGWENNPEIWKISNTIAPFSRYQMQQFVNNVHDIFVNKQLRLVIALNSSGKAVGAIDLFDFDPLNLRAGVGILIGEAEYRKSGLASEALELVIEYAFRHLNLHQLYCSVVYDNEASMKLFQKYGFEVCGTKKQWLRNGNQWDDEYLLQLINKSTP